MTLTDLWTRWMGDLEGYCRSGLKVLDKRDEVVPLRWNAMQRTLHAALTRQLEEIGRVRALILKARQMGCSTYVAARFFAHMHLRPKGARAYLLAHEDDASKKITRIYHRFYDHHDPNLRRIRTRNSDHELAFLHGGGLESATASTPSGGRSGTVSLYHGSEVAFWLHASEHAAGSMQQMSTQPGTEMILESTANGPIGAFYERWRSAEQGRNEFIPLFFPWTIDPGYVADVPRAFALSHEPPNDVVLCESEYADVHRCSMEQMAWRRAKIDEFDALGEDGALKFAQEYPATAQEAFLGVSGKSLLSPADVEAARRRPTFIGALERLSPLVLGLDPAPAHGQSQCALAYRRGSICYGLDRRGGLGIHELTEWVYARFMEERADRLCIDCSEGTGQALYEELGRRPGTRGHVVRVIFGGKPRDRSRYYNLRAQMWADMARWIREGGAIPDERLEGPQPTLAMELLSVNTKAGSERVIQIESKEDVIKRLGKSPDGADALACTFVLPDPAGTHGNLVVGRDGPIAEAQGIPPHLRTGYPVGNVFAEIG